MVGGSWTQLLIAKYLKRAGFNPVLVSSRKEFIGRYLLDDELLEGALPGLPMTGAEAVIFSAEEPLFTETVVDEVFDKGIWSGEGGVPLRAFLIAPASATIALPTGPFAFLQGEQAKKLPAWQSTVRAFRANRKAAAAGAQVVRFGELFGGGNDSLAVDCSDIGLHPDIYKMTLEQFRELQDRSFDRLRLGANLLRGDAIRVPSPEELAQEQALSDEEKQERKDKEGYPEIDRTCRHTLVDGLLAMLRRPAANLAECTVLSARGDRLPDDAAWSQLISDVES